MTTTTYRKSSAPPPLTKRFLDGWRRFFDPSDFVTLFILILLLIATPLSLNAAAWPVSLSVIMPTTVLSVALGLIFARSRFGELLALLLSATYGAIFVLLFVSFTIPGDFTSSIYAVFEQTATWTEAVFTGGIDQNDNVFTLLVAILFWFLAYNAAWHTYRIDRVWRVIVPPGMILVTNVIFDTSDANLNLYLVLFVFASLLLIARSHLDAREWDWYNRGIRPPRNLRNQFINVGAVLASIVLFLGWLVPSNDVQERLDEFQQFLQSDPLQEMSELWNRLFSPVDAAGPTTADYYGGESLDLGGAIRLGDQEVFWVSVPVDGRRYYWRSRVFDVYEGGRWTPAAQIRLTNNNSPTDLQLEPTASRELVRQRFTIALNATRILYTVPQPLQVDLATRTDLFYTAPEASPSRAMNVSVVRPTRVIRRGESYTATSLISVATANELRGASQVYPEWVVPLYTYVSPSVTGRTRQLAQQIIAEAGATNPYDQAKAIERYLRQNMTYNETIPTPPRGQDPVDWFVFDHQEGYCNYYASAMIVMLRTLGIPSRMAAGFAQGTWDDVRQAYVVTERDAHTWVEVYFPGYGWIEFEPTSAQAEIDRQGDDQPLVEQPVAPEQPTQPPTLTPTPEPSPTPDPTSTPEEDSDEDDSSNPPPFEEPTPTPSPTPTPTPVIIPTQPAPLPPDSNNPLEFILPALGVFLLLLFGVFVVFMMGLFLYWWWEWRGLRGLTSISRAYARLERYIPLIGIVPSHEETTEERRNRIVRVLPVAQRPVTAITRMYATERYGRRSTDAVREQQTSEAADQAWLDTRGSILKRWSRRFRFWSRTEDE